MMDEICYVEVRSWVVRSLCCASLRLLCTLVEDKLFATTQEQALRKEEERRQIVSSF